MKRLLFCLLLIGAFAQCKKAIQQAKQDAVVDVLVANKWYIAQYVEGTTVYTADFDGYEFTFNNSFGVTATKGTVATNGTWSADANTQKFSANFSAGNPLARCNGNWAIYYYDSQGPKMNRFENGVELKMTLRIK